MRPYEDLKSIVPFARSEVNDEDHYSKAVIVCVVTGCQDTW